MRGKQAPPAGSVAAPSRRSHELGVLVKRDQHLVLLPVEPAGDHRPALAPPIAAHGHHRVGRAAPVAAAPLAGRPRPRPRSARCSSARRGDARRRGASIVAAACRASLRRAGFCDLFPHDLARAHRWHCRLALAGSWYSPLARSSPEPAPHPGTPERAPEDDVLGSTTGVALAHGATTRGEPGRSIQRRRQRRSPRHCFLPSSGVLTLHRIALPTALDALGNYGRKSTLCFGRNRRVMFMTQEKLMLILTAIAVVEGTLSLLIAAIGILAALVVAAFVVGALSGVFIAYYTLARDDS